MQRRGGNLEIKDWDWLLSTTDQNALNHQPPLSPSKGQGLRDWEAAFSKGMSADAQREGSLKQASEGSEEAQAYLARVLASLVPAQRLIPLSSAGDTQAGSDEAVEAAGGGKASKERQTGSIARQGDGDLPNGSSKLGPSSSLANSRLVLSDGSGAGEPGRSSAGPQSKMALHEPNLHLEPNVHWRAERSSAKAAEVAPIGPESAMKADGNEAEPVPQPEDEVSEPAPRAKLVVLPSIRGGAVQNPAVAVRTTPRVNEDQTGTRPDVASLITGRSESQVNGPDREGLTSEARGKGAEPALGEDTGAVQAEGGPQAGQVPKNTESEMEVRVRILEVLQRRTLELQEQKLQHEVRGSRLRVTPRSLDLV